VWDTPHDVVLDFYALGPLEPDEGIRIATGIVRVRVPRTIVFDMVMHLNRSLGPLDEHRG
jgi:hypothetical protein